MTFLQPKKRRVLLKKRQLFIYNAKEDQRPELTLDLTHAEVNENPKKKDRFALQLMRHKNQTHAVTKLFFSLLLQSSCSLQFKAPSASECDRWVNALRDAAKGLTNSSAKEAKDESNFYDCPSDEEKIYDVPPKPMPVIESEDDLDLPPPPPRFT